jgi:hypothetical protein
MEDDYQKTLKGKIKILYQLEKWQDVIKLGDQYSEKYGKDVEVDMLRFKSGRHLNKTAAIDENKARIITAESQVQGSSESVVIPEIEAEEEPPQLLTLDQEVMQNPGMLVINEIPSADQQPQVDDKLLAEQFPETNELIITDPYAENEPVFSPDLNEPPVILLDSEYEKNDQVPLEPRAEEMAIDEESPSEIKNTKITFDFKSI